jgi:hypothetical protein
MKEKEFPQIKAIRPVDPDTFLVNHSLLKIIEFRKNEKLAIERIK